MAARFINVREVMPDNTLRGIEIYGFEADGRLGWIRAAEQANWRGNQTWDLQQVVETRFSSRRHPGRRAARSQDWQSVLTPDILSVLLVAPEKMSARTLWRYVAHLKENGQKATRYELALWSKFISPFVIPIMMLIVMPFAIQGPRAGGTSSKIFIGILAGLGFHLLSRLFGHLGLVERLAGGGGGDPAAADFSGDRPARASGGWIGADAPAAAAGRVPARQRSRPTRWPACMRCRQTGWPAVWPLTLTPRARPSTSPGNPTSPN